MVNVANNGTNGSNYVFAVGGTGVPDAPEILVRGTNGAAILDRDMSVSVADGTYFGGAPILSGAVDRVFTITNSGPVDLVLSNVTFQGAGAAQFSARAYPSIVSPSGGSNLLIQFSPLVAGVITAVVVIANNDSDENPYEFAVMGLGNSTHYVWTNSPTPDPPYLSWDTAAHTVQEAVSICVDDDIVLATNGVYDSGSVVIDSVTNRVGSTNRIRLCSVNGPEFTLIVGDSNMRCIYFASNAILEGFTITNGHSFSGGGVSAAQYYYGSDRTTIISNCVISGNQATGFGGGVRGCTILDSLISGNTATFGGGGVADATLYRCRLAQNQAGSYNDEKCCDSGGGICWKYGATVGGGGGGAYDSTLASCLLIDNLADAGGGASQSSLWNCTLISNQASGIYYSGDSGTVYGGGGGIFSGSAVNSIFDGNTDLTQPTNSDWVEDTDCGWTRAPSITYCCMANPPDGDGNVTGRVTFISGTYQLEAGSLGIDAGTNYFTGTTDLAGQPRIVNGTVDMGTYEFQGSANPDSDGDGIPDDWENSHGLNPTVSNSPTMNSDDDDQPDIDEYIADTQPTNGASYFPLVVLTNPPLGTMVLVVDPTSTARVYGVRWTTNLLATPQLWTLIPPEKTGTGSVVTFTVTNDGPGRIYRTGVRRP